MKIIKRFPHLGEGVMEIGCDCGYPFNFDTKNLHNNGYAKCPRCPAIVKIEDVEGINDKFPEHRITIRPALDIAPNAWRANCQHCTASVVIYFPKDFYVVCPSCAETQPPEIEVK